KSIYSYPNPMRIVGVVKRLARPDVGAGIHNNASTVFPILPNTSEINYVLRTAPQDRARVLKAATAALYRMDGNRVVRNQATFEQLRHAYFHRNRSMIGLLLASVLGLMLVTALGITGLA